MTQETSHTFQWPPKVAPEPEGDNAARAIDVPVPVVLPPRERAVVAWWREIEATWLEPTVPALSVRMREAQWEPDASSVYCNCCGVSVGAFEQDEFGCASCRDVRWPWDRFVRLGVYEGALRHWIHEVKFRRWRAIGLELGEMLGESLRLAGCPNDALIVPVPISRSRKVLRGIDHTLVLAQGMRRSTGYAIRRMLRARSHRSQWLVVPSQRTKNVSDVFGFRGSSRPQGQAIVLVDDVRTSGATLGACARLLRSAGPGKGQPAAIWACAVGVAAEPGRKADSGQG